jgi:CHRD domain/Bacterial Ig domain
VPASDDAVLVICLQSQSRTLRICAGTYVSPNTDCNRLFQLETEAERDVSGRILGIRTSFVLMLLPPLLSGCGGGGGYGGGGGSGGGSGGGYGGDGDQTNTPTITLAAPGAGAANRTATLTANVIAPAGVTRVEFLVDGTVVGTSTTAPYTFAWDTSTVADGAHTLTARVTDAANVVATSAPATVTVNNNPTINVALTPDETFPRPASSASGSGSLTFNLLSGAVSGGVTVSGVAATLAHIRTGYAGVAGPVIVNFVQNASDPNRWEPQAGSLLTAEQIGDLLIGKLYVNVHSAAYPQGEIRSQLQPENIDVVITPLNGASVSPPVTTSASGFAATTLDQGASVVTVHVNTIGAEDANAAHVHKAASGANNSAALITLTQDASAVGHWLAEAQPVAAADRTDFANNGWYVDVHTPVLPNGVLRGQIAPNQASAATLTQLQSSIFTPICSACHNGAGGSLPGSMNLTSASASFAALVNVASVEQASVLRVAPNNPDGSYLVRKLEGTSGITGARMPLGGPFLDQATIDRVRSWISAGAQNN